MSAPDPDDDTLLGLLRGAVSRFDTPPDALSEANRALFSWRDPDAELATLVSDSRQLSATVRGPAESVFLRFAAGGRAITVEIAPTAGGRHRLIGQLEPGQRGTVEIRRRAEPVVAVECDDLGRFQAEDVGRGPISFRWASAAADPIETPWLLL
jgi:hypothetical protein